VKYIYRVQLRKIDYCQVDVESNNELTPEQLIIEAKNLGNQEFGQSDCTEIEEIELVRRDEE